MTIEEIRNRISHLKIIKNIRGLSKEQESDLKELNQKLGAYWKKEIKRLKEIDKKKHEQFKKAHLDSMTITRVKL